MELYYAWLSNAVSSETLETIKKLHDTSNPEDWKRISDAITDITECALIDGKESTETWAKYFKSILIWFKKYILGKV